MHKAKVLITDIQLKKMNWNERSQFIIDNVKNLSMSDLDTLTLYAETYLKYGFFKNLMEPRGAIKTVLAKYGLMEGNQRPYTNSSGRLMSLDSAINDIELSIFAYESKKERLNKYLLDNPDDQSAKDKINAAEYTMYYAKIELDNLRESKKILEEMKNGKVHTN